MAHLGHSKMSADGQRGSQRHTGPLGGWGREGLYVGKISASRLHWNDWTASQGAWGEDASCSWMYTIKSVVPPRVYVWPCPCHCDQWIIHWISDDLGGFRLRVSKYQEDRLLFLRKFYCFTVAEYETLRQGQGQPLMKLKLMDIGSWGPQISRCHFNRSDKEGNGTLRRRSWLSDGKNWATADGDSLRLPGAMDHSNPKPLTNWADDTFQGKAWEPWNPFLG